MANNGALFYAIAGIVFMSMIVPMILNPLPVAINSYSQSGTGITGQASLHPNNPPVTCIDNDGNDIYTKSYVTYKEVDYVDSCSGEQLNEMICSPVKNGKSEKSSANYHCAYGCYNGACKTRPAQIETCADTDNGLIQETAGTVSGYKSDSSYYSYDDYCPGTDKLAEYYCYNNQPFFEEIPCTTIVNGTMVFNYVCENGACILK